MNDDLARKIDAALALGLDWVRAGESIIATGAYRGASAEQIGEARAALRQEAASAFEAPPAITLAAEPEPDAPPPPEPHDDGHFDDAHHIDG